MTKKYKRLFRLAYRSCKALAIVSALFSLSVCVLLISNYLRFRSAEAYISNLSLIRLGIFLLAGGTAVLLISSTFMFILHRQVTERVKTDVGKMSATPAGLSGNILIVGAGIGLVAIALVFAFLSYAAIERNHGSIETGIASLKSIQEAARERARIEAESVVYKNYLAAEELKVNWPSFREPGGVGVALNADPPTTYGVFSCLDGNTGEVYWVHEFKEGSYASPILAGDEIYWTDRSGFTHIFKAEKEFTLIGEPELGEQCQTTAAFVGERIYIRGQKHLFCIGNPEK